jgi:hypothetical protein
MLLLDDIKFRISYSLNISHSLLALGVGIVREKENVYDRNGLRGFKRSFNLYI